MAISSTPSKKRKPIRLNTKKAKARRLAYHARMKDAAAKEKAKKYRKEYYAKHKAAILKKAKATYEARKEEFLKKAKARRRAAGIKPRSKKAASKA